MSLAFIACWSPENKFRAPLKRSDVYEIKEENETNVRSKSDECNTCNRAAGIKETDNSFLRDFITRILITAILHL